MFIKRSSINPGDQLTERKIDCVPKVEIIYDMFEDLSINIEG